MTSSQGGMGLQINQAIETKKTNVKISTAQNSIRKAVLKRFRGSPQNELEEATEQCKALSKPKA